MFISLLGMERRSFSKWRQVVDDDDDGNLVIRRCELGWRERARICWPLTPFGSVPTLFWRSTSYSLHNHFIHDYGKNKENQQYQLDRLFLRIQSHLTSCLLIKMEGKNRLKGVLITIGKRDEANRTLETSIGLEQKEYFLVGLESGWGG